MSGSRFVVSLTADFYDAAGAHKFPDVDVSVLARDPLIDCRRFAEHRSSIGADQINGAQGVIVLTPAITAQTVAKPDQLLVLARFGVGYDNVDVAACSAANVLVTITARAVDRPVAEATLGWMLALSHHTRAKDQLVRTCRWDDRSKFLGSELRDHTLGLIGFGRIARKLAELLRGFGMKEILVFDPSATPENAAALGVRLADFDEVMRHSDFISIHCPLNQATRGLIGERELALMKPTAFLINTARGGIVDEGALYNALKGKKFAGAAIDCFAEEPVTKPHPLAELDNVLLAPHAIAWTHEAFRDMGRAACQVMIDMARGVRPHLALNPELFDRPEFLAKWKRYQSNS